MSMNIFDITGDLGTTSKSKEYAEWSVEAMQEEINAIAEMHNNMDELEKDTVFYKACEAEMNLKLMAAMEAECVEDATAIFEKYNLVDEFAMEAAKDVLAREAYRGIAKIKTLVAAIIKFIQEMLTFGGTINKAYAKLKKLAKSIRDGLKKKAGSKKVQEDKFVKELTVLPTNRQNNGRVSIIKIKEKYDSLTDKGITEDAITLLHLYNRNRLKSYGLSSDLAENTYSNFPTEALESYKEALQTEYETAKDDFKDNKEEFEKNELLTKAIENASAIYDDCDELARDRGLKQAEKMKKTISKLTSDRYIKQAFPSTTQDPTVRGLSLTAALNCIQLTSQLMGMEISFIKKVHKLGISVYDKMLTECKAVEAMAA